MEDNNLFENLDWDPCYLARIFDTDFNNMSELWNDSDGSVEKLLVQ